jgi:RNA polymerase sigma factor (sigma-70 family)
MSSDERLALRAAGGDRRAFEEIYHRYHQDLYRFCLAMVGNPQDAQDALQNTMLKVLRSLPGEKRTIRLKPWLFRIARNESIETLRKRRDTSELESQQAAVTGVTETAETRERLRTLLADLEQLPERQRSALVLRELSGLDFEQIGATFGTSTAVARQTLYEARLSLRQLEAGREMPCVDVMRELSDADGRVTRRREIRAHLRSCPDCRAFQDEIGKRHEDLAALAPLPLAAATGMLHGVLGGKVGAGLSGVVGAGAGKAVATSAVVKTVATAAVVAVVGVTAADRGGLIDIPLPGKQGQPAGQEQADSSARASGADPDSQGSAASASAAPDRGQAAGNSPNSTSPSELGNGDAAKHAGGGASAAPGGESSASERGTNPPGGGYGRTASERHGPPEGHPEAASRGQQTAAAHKPESAPGSPPGKGPPGNQGNSGDKPASSQGAAHKATPPPAHSEPPDSSDSGIEQPSMPPDSGSSGSFNEKGNGHRGPP